MEIGISFGQIAQPQGFKSWVWTSIFHPALTVTFWVTLGEKNITGTFPCSAAKGTMSVNAYKEMDIVLRKERLCIPHPSGEAKIPPLSSCC